MYNNLCKYFFKSTADNDITGRRYVDPYPSQQMQESPRKKRSANFQMFKQRSHEITPQVAKIRGYLPEKYTSYFTNGFKLF